MGRATPDFSLFGHEHVRQYEATDGTVGHDWNGTSCLILRTIGRRSGEVRKVPRCYGRDGNDSVVVASKGGAPDHPVWYYNVRAHPLVEVQDGSRKQDMTAREVSGDERAAWWERAVAAYPPYAEYQQKTTRQIPVFVLEPVSES